MKINYYNKIILFLFLILNFSLLEAQNLNKSQGAANDFYFALIGKSGNVKNYIILNKNEDIQNYVFNYENGGFIMISGKTNEIIAFSEVNEYNLKGLENSKIIAGNFQTISVVNNSIVQKTTTLAAKKAAAQIDPLLTDVWGGVNCKDDEGNTVYPSNYYTPSHCSPGCVAISLAQVLHYYEWPKRGVGNQVYGENYSGNYKRHQAFFDGVNYDWNNMLDEYMNKPSTDVQQKAVGELMYHTGVALQMNYEPSGSTSNIDKTPFVYKNFFRFTSHYEDVSWSDFWTRLYDNIQHGRPVPVAVDASRTGDGHVFVANGYKEIDDKPYYYLNWGWYDDNGVNGWYNIQDWTSASPGYNTITGASFDVLPNPQISEINSSGFGNDFTVNWIVSDKISVEEYTLEQKVDQGDWTELATGISQKEYTVGNPSGKVYQFRVKAKVDGSYYTDSWSEIEVYSADGGYNGIVNFGGSQYAYSHQTPDNDLNFTGDYTFETWIKLMDGNSNGNIILDQQYAFGLELTEVTGSNYAVKFISHGSGKELVSNKNGSKIQNNQWAHIAVSKSGNAIKLFIDGSVMDEYSGSEFNLSSSNSALNIAEKYRGGYASHIKAEMDQIRLSNTGRYSNSFTPNQDVHFAVDDKTIAYFAFQDVHGVRLKDEAYNLSVIVSNTSGNAEWTFEHTGQVLANEDFELLQSTLNVYPNPIINNRFRILFASELDLGDIEINMFDLTGRKVPIKIGQGSFKSWNVLLQKLSTGIYILRIKGEGFTANRKIIVQ